MLRQFGAPGVTMSWDEGFPGARASRPHKTWHSPARISHRVAGCSMKGIYFQYLIGFLMRACKYRRRWARSGLSFSPQRAHARSTVETATLFAREHALREKFLRHPALFSRVQPPGEKCRLAISPTGKLPFGSTGNGAMALLRRGRCGFRTQGGCLQHRTEAQRRPKGQDAGGTPALPGDAVPADAVGGVWRATSHLVSNKSGPRPARRSAPRPDGPGEGRRNPRSTVCYPPEL